MSKPKVSVLMPVYTTNKNFETVQKDFDNELNQYYVYIFAYKEESSDIFFIVNEKDYNLILEICNRF